MIMRDEDVVEREAETLVLGLRIKEIEVVDEQGKIPGRAPSINQTI